MKKQIFEILGLVIAIFAIVIIFRFAISTRFQGNNTVVESPEDIAHLLEERLKQLEVSVVSVKLTRQSPLEIEITLQNPIDEDHSSKIDYWDMCISRRETELAYLNYGTHINSYRMIILDIEGENIFDSTIYLNPDLPSQQFDPGAPSGVNLDQTKDTIRQTLDVGNLKLLSLDVPPKYFDQWNSKLVTIDLSTGVDSHQDAEPLVNEFIIGLKPQIEAINQQYGTRIAMVWVKIYDARENLLVHYFEDIDLGHQTFRVADDFHGGWYSEPPPDVPTPYATLIPTAIPIHTEDFRTPAPTDEAGMDSEPYPSPPYP